MRLIDADEIEKKIQEAQTSLESDNDTIWEMNKGRWKGLTWARRIVIDAPTVEAEPIRLGRWEHHFDEFGCYYEACSCCGGSPVSDEDGLYGLLTDYCPRCGAKMDESTII